MNRLEIRIEWSGPFNLETIIEIMNSAGSLPDYEGDDYGLYQIYGKHILCGPDTLLYIGQTTEQTFSDRFKQHKNEWLDREQNIQIYVGRVYDPERHSKIDNWNPWKEDV